MHLSTTIIAAAAGLASSAYATCVQSNGNWYCNQVQAVSYLNLGKAGTFNRVTYMNETTGECDFASQSYSGSISPFDEELSIHLRGPLYLKQFAYYTPTTASSKKREEEVETPKRRSHLKNREPVEESSEIQERATTITCPGSNSTTYVSSGDTFMIECGFDRPGNIGMVYTSTFSACIDKCATTANCVDVSYLPSGGACYMKSSITAPNYASNVYGARLVSSASSSSSSTSPSTSSKASSTLASTTKSSTTSTSTTSTSTTSTKASTTSTSTSTSSTSSSASPTATGGSWTRQSYYSSTAGTAQNVMFLNTMGGGTVSGVWSSQFGSSLSYASSDGTKAASTPQILSDMTISSATELAIFTGTACSGSNCGYYRPGIPAYHGFGGAQKILIFEFSMPLDTTGNNMPAIWLLNALIPRTQQYGSCNCWGNTNGCGELDIFETLTSGEVRMTSSIHGNQASGDSDYFARPTSGTIKAAIVLSQSQLTIKILNSAFVIGSTLSATDYANLFSSSQDSYVAGSNVSTVSLS